MIYLLLTGLVAFAQTANLQKECFEQNKARSCVRLGTTLWQKPESREEAKKAFVKGCELKEESACALKEMKVAAAPAPVPKAAADSKAATATAPAAGLKTAGEAKPAAEVKATTDVKVTPDVKAATEANSPSADTKTSETAKPAAKVGAIQKTGPTTFKVSRSAALGYAKNLEATLASATMEAKAGANGAVEGYRFVDIQNGSVFEALGFTKEDVVTHVNGRAVNSPSQATAMLPSLAWLERYEIKFIRGGKPQVHKYQMTE